MNYLILVGGEGTRLKSIVSEVPKPLAPLGNKPFLEIFLNKVGFSINDNIHLLCGYKSDHFIEFAKKSDYKINIIVEDMPLGTGGAIKNAFNLLNLECAVIFNGDCIQDIDLDLLNKKINLNKEESLMVLRQVSDGSRYGSVKVENKIITNFNEKTNQKCALINSGIYYLNKIAINLLPNHHSSLEKDLFEKSLKDLNIRPYIVDGDFIDIGIPKDYLKAKDLYS